MAEEKNQITCLTKFRCGNKEEIIDIGMMIHSNFDYRNRNGKYILALPEEKRKYVIGIRS